MKKLLILFILVGIGVYAFNKSSNTKQQKLEALYDTPYIVVYGKQTCSWTQKCLTDLKRQGIDVIFEDIDKNEVKMEIFPRIDAAGHKRNQISIPIVDVNGHILIGYEPDKILELYQQY
jgi:arsenate reductase-like glutaredoxin family protein